MANTQERFIPASALASRLDKVRAKIEALSHQMDDLRREEKLLSGILRDAVDRGPSSIQSRETQSAEPKQQRAKGVVDAIVELIQSKPGITRDALVDGLKHLNVNPFDLNAARRTIINNLGNQIRSGKVRESPMGNLFLVEADGFNRNQSLDAPR